ncbi:hypothetical protein FRB99_005967 [Tulasnella sp. 403]|nr:hypothetical protein FRB99_005967 [Tulasnella sp. 403]
MWWRLAYCLLAVAVPLVRAGPHQVTAATVNLSPGWNTDSFLCGNQWASVWTLTLGANANYTFTGTGIDVYGVYSAKGGLSTIILDGATVGSFNSLPPLQAPCQAHIFSASGLPLGPHTIAIYLTQYGPDNLQAILELSHFIYDDPNVPGVFVPSTSLPVPSPSPTPTPTPTPTPSTTSVPATSTPVPSPSPSLNPTTQNNGVAESKTSNGPSVVTIAYVPSGSAAQAQAVASHRPTAAVIAAAVFGSIVGVAVLAFLIWWFCIRDHLPQPVYGPDGPAVPPMAEAPRRRPPRVFNNPPMWGTEGDECGPNDGGPVVGPLRANNARLGANRGPNFPDIPHIYEVE